MTKEVKGGDRPGKKKKTVIVDHALWMEFKRWAKEQGKTLPKAIEDALRSAMIKQQAEVCIAGDGKEEEGEKNHTAGI
jgi:macrodomain Ter protein organizer (MatP/YcbG family)